MLLRLDGHRAQRATAGFDLALTEVLDDGEHRFLVEVGQRRAAPRCSPSCRTARRRPATSAAAEQAWSAPPPEGRELDTDGHQGAALPQPRAPALGRRRRPLPDLRQLHDGLPDLLLHARVEDVTDLAGEEAERARVWDSCFTLDHSYIHGGSVRGSTASRATASG